MAYRNLRLIQVQSYPDQREAIPSLHQSNLNPTRYGRLHIALPPKEEQRIIREFRARLIADVVTGKLDVREEKEGLLDKQEELTPLSDTTDITADLMIVAEL